MDQIRRLLRHDPSELSQASDGPSRQEPDVRARRDHLGLDTVGPVIQARDDGLDPGILERREELGERAFGPSAPRLSITKRIFIPSTDAFTAVLGAGGSRGAGRSG